MTNLSGIVPAGRPLRISAVSFLNTVPLVWGLIRKPHPHVDLQFRVPSAVADDLANGTADIGIVPCGELDRLGLDFLPDTGIACTGAVRSILLISRVSPERIQTLAADSSSRTSVRLARIILKERYGASPSILTRAPRWREMLDEADAALIIGDPALRINPLQMPGLQVLDLGLEWFRMTGAPMVFAVWAGAQSLLTPRVRELFIQSCEAGLNDIAAIAARAPETHGIPEALAHTYLTRNIEFRLTPDHLRGLALYRAKVLELEHVASVI